MHKECQQLLTSFRLASLQLNLRHFKIICAPSHSFNHQGTHIFKYAFQNAVKQKYISSLMIMSNRSFRTSKPRYDLMEFFDHKDNWGEQEIRSGRAWTIDELRIKSNSDLHKLWYVLLKEKNMLLTMEQAAKKEVELFPSPERIDKVEISMENIESVVRERNEAYFLLETGQTGERPHNWKEDEFGRFNYVPLDEYPIPVKENEKYMEEDLFPTMETVNPTGPEFLLKLSEKERTISRRKRREIRGHIKLLFNKFPNIDMEALQAEYPEVDVYAYKKYLVDKDEL